jgi:ubiquinone/menaquinone biosynthesis C-methylase UbiE
VATDRELEELKAKSRASWDGAPDYRLLAERLDPASEELVRACGIGPGIRVLDVAAGSGNAAVHAARAGAEVSASDFAPGQVELGRKRTLEEGLPVAWVQADVEELPFDDESFDCVVSVFGAQFAPRPERVAAELFRVVRPGGTVGMANWPERGFQAGVFEIMRRYRPPDPDGIPPSGLWGDEQAVRERFDELAESVAVEPRILPWRFDSFEEMGTVFQRGAPRAADLANTLPPERLQQMAADFGELIARHNQADDGRVVVDAEYAQVVARKKS